jgi:hypothetical protein
VFSHIFKWHGFKSGIYRGKRDSLDQDWLRQSDAQRHRLPTTHWQSVVQIWTAKGETREETEDVTLLTGAWETALSMRTAPATSTATPVTQVRLVPYLLITYTQLDPTMLAARAVCSCPQFSVYKEITLKAPVQSNHTITTMKGRLQKTEREKWEKEVLLWQWRLLTFKSKESWGSPLVPCFCRTFPMLFPAAAATVNATASHILSPSQVCDWGCWFKILKWVLGTLLSPAISQPSPSSLNFVPQLPSRTIPMSRKSASSPPSQLKQELVGLIFVQKWWPIHLPKYPCSCCQCQWAIAESYKETEVNPKTISASPEMHSYLWSQLQRKLKGIISHFVFL